MPAAFASPHETVAVIDFETTGMSPSTSGRATEIAAVLVEGGQIVGHYASLMNSGAWVPPFIEQLTGISNAMLARAPPAERVMREVAAFVGDCPLVAHNAAFDRAFWCAELRRADRDAGHRFACTMLLARRLYPESTNHRLGTLAALHRLPDAGRAHRALADAQTTAHLLLRMQRDVMQRFALRAVPHELLMQLQRAPRDRLAACVAGHGAHQDAPATPIRQPAQAGLT
jgi:DNA polymerase-3 subunit epsilon